MYLGTFTQVHTTWYENVISSKIKICKIWAGLFKHCSSLGMCTDQADVIGSCVLGIVSPMFKGGGYGQCWWDVHITFHLGARGSGSTRLVPVWGEFKFICLFFHAVVSHPCTPDYKGPQRAVWPHTQNCGSGNSDMSDHIFHPKVSRQVTQVINTFTCRNTRSVRKISWKKTKIAQVEEVC